MYMYIYIYSYFKPQFLKTASLRQFNRLSKYISHKLSPLLKFFTNSICILNRNLSILFPKTRELMRKKLLKSNFFNDLPISAK